MQFDHVTLRGSVDRVERSADGTTVIVDLKTGSRMPTQTSMPEHPQLAAYQLGFAAGAIGARGGARRGGAGGAGGGESSARSSAEPDAPSIENAVETPDAAELTLGGAKLVFVASGVRGKSYSERTQQPMDEEALEAFRERLRQVAHALAGAQFEGPVQLDFNDPLSRWEYRIHLVPAVSA